MVRNVKAERQPSVTVQVPTHIAQTEPMSSGSTIRDTDLSMQMSLDDSEDTVTGDSLSVLGRGVKELVQAVQALRHLGVEDLVLPLPKIVVVGDQSTGKSSLIEGMSEIKVPRSSGTCTRCPLEINLADGISAQWSCKVSIHKKYIYTGQLGTPKNNGKNLAKIEGATRARPLGPWVPQDVEDFHFATITSASQVEHVLYLAQLAVLNPSQPYEKYSYVPGKSKPQELYQVKFSPNVIRLDISGRNLPNLSFTDLPGVINVSDVPEEAYLVDLVKNLVKDYVCADDCINLLAIPMTDDPANSSASRLLRDLKADRRTVGCLTKPDRMQIGESLEQWIKILGDERHRLGFKYHVIKNNPDPSIDHATARLEEAAFFQQEEPWISTLSPFRNRFGTTQLQTLLSQLLTAQIQKSLPRIRDQVQCKADFIDAELKALPEAIEGNLPAIVMGELGKFTVELQKHIDGGSQMCPFQKDFHDLAIRFRQTLANTKPILKLRDAGMPPRRLPTRETPNRSVAGTPTPTSAMRAPPINVESDSEDDANPISSVHRSGSKRPFVTPSNSPNKMQRTESVSDQPASKNIQSKCFTLPDVRKIIHRGYISLPGQVDPKAIEELIRLSMEHWEKPVDNFLAQTKALCQNTVLEQVQTVFGHRQQTAYFNEILSVCDTFLEEALAEQLKIAKRVLSWELSKPKTLNERAMDQARDEAKTLLLSQRRKILAEPYLEEQEEKSNKRSTGTTRDEKLAKVPETELIPETFGPELKAMAETKGYYEVAYSRFVDNLCLSIHCELFLKCREKLVPCLKQKFGVLEADANERMAVLLAVNARDEERRAVLKREKATIDKALEQLEALG